jgi:hypothetical protein
LVNKAENAVTNPVQTSQGNTIHPMFRVLSLNGSWKVVGIIDVPIKKVPMHNITRKKGCEARTALFFLCKTVQPAHAIDMKIITVQHPSPITRAQIGIWFRFAIDGGNAGG